MVCLRDSKQNPESQESLEVKFRSPEVQNSKDKSSKDSLKKQRTTEPSEEQKRRKKQQQCEQQEKQNRKQELRNTESDHTSDPSDKW